MIGTTPPGLRPATIRVNQTEFLAQAQRRHAARLRFRGVADAIARNLGDFRNAVDFWQAGVTSATHPLVIYPPQIAMRVVKARTVNEAREHGLRDLLGMCFWFWITPIAQRLFINAPWTAPDVRDALLKQRPKPEGDGIIDFFKRLNWKYNPLGKWDLVSSKTIEHRMHNVDALLRDNWRHENPGHYTAEQVEHLAKEFVENNREKTVKFLTRLKETRNFATAVGLFMSFVLLGVGINLLNIWLTQRDVERRRQEAAQNQGYQRIVV